MKKPLPDGQYRLFKEIEDFVRVNGYPPSIQELANALGVASTFGVRKQLDALEKKQYIKRDHKLARTITIL